MTNALVCNYMDNRTIVNHENLTGEIKLFESEIDLGDELFGVDGFAEVMFGAYVVAVDHIGRGVHSGQENDRDAF